jgi:peptide deformylase
MEGNPFGFPFDPDELQRAMAGMAEQAQKSQSVAWADNAINLAVQMTVAAINRLELTGSPEEQAQQVRQAIALLFPETVTLVREARQGLT